MQVRLQLEGDGHCLPSLTGKGPCSRLILNETTSSLILQPLSLEAHLRERLDVKKQSGVHMERHITVTEITRCVTVYLSHTKT